jgi:hypothetical protein
LNRSVPDDVDVFEHPSVQGKPIPSAVEVSELMSSEQLVGLVGDLPPEKVTGAGREWVVSGMRSLSTIWPGQVDSSCQLALDRIPILT